MGFDAKTIAEPGGSAIKTDVVEWDNELPRFGLRTRRRGEMLHKTWIVQYRAGGRSRKTTLGDARIVPAAKAREAARKLLAKIVLGQDPQADRAAKRQAAHRTFKTVTALYLEAYRRKRRPNSYRVTTLYLTGAYFKPLHTMGISEIAHADIAMRIRSIENNHSAATASAARRAVSALFAWAIAEGLMGRNPVNPVIGTRRPEDPSPRDRFLSIAELVAVWRATEHDPQATDGWRDFCRIIRLLMLLGARANEVGGMAWEEFDLEAGVWALPKERSKNNRAHAILLSKPALDIIASVRRRPEGERLFGSPHRGFTQWGLMKGKLDARLADKVGSWRAHDLRRSTATHMAEIGVMPHVIEATLNHYSGHRAGIAGVYNKATYDREVAAALARWSEHLLAAVEGRAENDRVVPLRA